MVCIIRGVSMKKPLYMFDYERSITIYFDHKTYKVDTSDKRYPEVLNCIKKSQYDEILNLLQKI